MIYTYANTQEVLLGHTYKVTIRMTENDDSKNHNSTPHPIIAGASDFYFFSLIVGSIAALFASITNTPITISLYVGISFLVSSLCLIIYYYKFMALKYLFCTPGETLAGRIIVDNKKQWCNPYSVNRGALFFLIFAWLALLGNTWDSVLFSGLIYNFGTVLVKIVILLFVCGSLVSIGKGSLIGGSVFVCIYGYQALAISKSSDTSMQLMGNVLMIVVIFHIVIISIYLFLCRKSYSWY